jgi:hypothetical protein
MIAMSLLDPKWKYTHSTATDIRKTFAKARKQISKKEQPNARPPKLQLMPALSVTADSRGAGHASKSSGFGTRSMAADGSSASKHAEHAALMPVRRDRRLGWP